MNILSNIADILSIASFIPILISFIVIIKGEIRKRRIIDINSKSLGYRPVIIIVDLVLNTEIKNQVVNWLKDSSTFKNMDMPPVLTLNRNTSIQNENDVEKVLTEFAELYKKACEYGADKIHLFYGGPSSIAAMIGAMLANRITVLVYQHDPKQGVYIPLGTMERLLW